MDDIKENLCKNLIYFRKKNKLTQVGLAEKLGYSNKNISKWETGEITPDIFLLNDLARIYNITVDELLNGERIHEDDEILLREEIEKNKKMRRRIILLSFSLFCFVVLSVCTLISVIIASSHDQNKYQWIVYGIGVSICSIPLYVYYKIFDKKTILSLVFLVLFINSLSLTIYYSTNCSPWLFLIDLPLFFVIYFFSYLMNTIVKYRQLKKKNKYKK